MASISEHVLGVPKLVFGDGLPLGHEIVDSLGQSYAHTQHLEIPTRQGVTNLRQAIRYLLSSTVADDVEKVRGINSALATDGTALVDADLSIVSKVLPLYQIPALTDQQLVQFASWNVDRHHQHQSALDAVTPELTADTLDRVSHLVGIGLYPTHALDMYEAALRDRPPLRALDSFEAGAHMALAFYRFYDGWTGMSNLFEDPANFVGVGSALQDVHLHEADHDVSDRFGISFLFGITQKPDNEKQPRLRFIDEPINQHGVEVSGTQTTARPDNIMPSERGSEKQFYRSEAELLGWLTQYGIQPVSAAELHTARFDPDLSSSRRRSVHNRLSTSAGYVFPEMNGDPLLELGKQYEVATSLTRQALLTQWISRFSDIVVFDELADDDMEDSISDLFGLRRSDDIVYEAR